MQAAFCIVMRDSGKHEESHLISSPSTLSWAGGNVSYQGLQVWPWRTTRRHPQWGLRADAPKWLQQAFLISHHLVHNKHYLGTMLLWVCIFIHPSDQRKEIAFFFNKDGGVRKCHHWPGWRVGCLMKINEFLKIKTSVKLWVQRLAVGHVVACQRAWCTVVKMLQLFLIKPKTFECEIWQWLSLHRHAGRSVPGYAENQEGPKGSERCSINTVSSLPQGGYFRTFWGWVSCERKKKHKELWKYGGRSRVRGGVM